MKNQKQTMWLPVTEEPFAERYEVSNEGDVREKKTGRLLAENRNVRSHYHYVMLYNPTARVGRNRPIHRLVAFAFIGNPPEGRNDINHIDGNRENNVVTNLEWVSRRENMEHANHVLGTVKKGSDHPSYGKPLAPEVKTKISESLRRTFARQGGTRRGAKNSEQWKQRMREWVRLNGHPRKGVHFTEEQIARISASCKERWKDPELRRRMGRHVSETYRKKRQGDVVTPSVSTPAPPA